MTEELLWVDTIAQAQAALRRLVRGTDVDFFAYGNSRPGLDNPYWDSTYPAAWMEHYFARRYQFIDPVVLECQRSTMPFAWRFLQNRGEGLSPEQSRLFAEAAAHGLHDGFTIPFRAPTGCVAAMSFAFRSREEMESFATIQPRLKLVALYYHSAIERLLEVSLPAEELTGLERQCLTLLAHGRTLWEISGLLHRPESDIALHLRSARDKMGAANTTQAVDKAIALGLISP